MRYESIRFEEATLEQLTRAEKLIDDLWPSTIDFLLRWTTGEQKEWAADLDLQYFEEQYGK